MPIALCNLPGADGPLVLVPITLTYGHLPTGNQQCTPPPRPLTPTCCVFCAPIAY